MYRYRPRRPPDPAMWLSLDEQDRIGLVEAFHRSERIELPNAKVHAAFHVIVENQIAEAHDPVVRAIDRLAGEGLDRHECIHAVAWVLSQQFYSAAKSEHDEAKANVQSQYDSAVERLSAASWRAQATNEEA